MNKNSRKYWENTQLLAWEQQISFYIIAIIIQFNKNSNKTSIIAIIVKLIDKIMNKNHISRKHWENTQLLAKEQKIVLI